MLSSAPPRFETDGRGFIAKHHADCSCASPIISCQPPEWFFGEASHTETETVCFVIVTPCRPPPSTWINTVYWEWHEPDDSVSFHFLSSLIFQLCGTQTKLPAQAALSVSRRGRKRFVRRFLSRTQQVSFFGHSYSYWVSQSFLFH